MILVWRAVSARQPLKRIVYTIEKSHFAYETYVFSEVYVSNFYFIGSWVNGIKETLQWFWISEKQISW